MTDEKMITKRSSARSPACRSWLRLGGTATNSDRDLQSTGALRRDKACNTSWI